MDEARDKIIQHYRNPKNFGKPVWTPTYSAHVANYSCGDEITIYLNIEKNQAGIDIVKDVQFEGEGCSICLASASMLTERIKDQNIEEVKKLTLDAMLKEIAVPLNKFRQRCVEISLEALQRALKVIV